MGQLSSMTDTTPAITKSDAKDLKALVRSDYKFLRDELSRRRTDLEQQVQDEREQRKEEDEKAAARELAALVRRVNTLNDAIIAKLTELSSEGWKQRGGGYRYDQNGGNEITPHSFTVNFNFDSLVPPSRDNSDLNKANETIYAQYVEAMRSIERNESDFVRELTLQSVTSEAAREFITALPTPEQLITAPQLGS
jgi:putative protein kinase ArgK-like GTPase of G3E family